MVSPSDFANRIKNEPKKALHTRPAAAIGILIFDLPPLPSDWHFRSQWVRQISS